MRVFSGNRNGGTLALLASCLLAFVLAGTQPARADLFGKKEIPFTDLRPFPKWTGMLDRYAQEQAAQGSKNCAGKGFNACQYDRWLAFIETLRDKPKDQQLSSVNNYFNRNPYILDSINWGEADYWETPGQFLAKSGDCEDYAIIKYMTLKRLGWPVEAMRVVVLEDMNLKAMHAVLAVTFEGRQQILDNQIAVITDDRRIRHYRPIFAVNEEGWWRFF